MKCSIKRCKNAILSLQCALLMALMIPADMAHSESLTLRKDVSQEQVTGKFKPGSHVIAYLPNLPYISTSHSINAGLTKPSYDGKGWEYDLAVSHKIIDRKTYEFELRKGVRFQDGTPFDADSVVMNMEYFKKEPYTFSKMDTIFDRVEKLSSHRVRFHLKEDYGFFMHDTIWLLFYSEKYLKKHGWNGKPFCPNLAEAGPYGLGPYILNKGYIEADRHTPTAELIANPYYWGEDAPKVEKITVIIDIESQEALDLIQNTEGKLDLMPIPFSDELPTILSQHAKLVRSPSNNNYVAKFNLISGHPLLQVREVREALNRAIDQQALINLSMNGEGVLTPISLGERFYGVKEASRNIATFSELNSPLDEDVRQELIQIIKKHQKRLGYDPNEKLPITILAPKSTQFMFRDVKYLLDQIHIDVNLHIVEKEADVFANVVTTNARKNDIYYDIIAWANFDWIMNPWDLFFVMRPGNIWTSFTDDPKMESLLDEFLATPSEDASYIPVMTELIEYVYYQGYTLFLPSPNHVMAVNKEVIFVPSPTAIYPLWDIEVTDMHWSLREGEYPEHLKVPVEITTYHQ
ncbi:putative ABC-type dipeptide transport system,periplasmic component [Vibrio nigripulchritudo POn4]|nr:putative ABC-type dipeptide transport system,periplasmic component [Vibrio nigripulchritudo FTn2]CCN63125.1 putative ABC-type dipeptide transport system,periplasmic component [Vibrio nigripulchritudo POn4]